MASARRGRRSAPVENFDDENTPEFFRRAVKASHKADLEESRPLRANPCTSQMDYSAEECEFLKAVDEYKRATGRQFMQNSEYFALLTKRLGYVKGDPPVEDE